MTDDILQIETLGAIRRLTLNRPNRLNALNQPLTDALLAYSRRGAATVKRGLSSSVARAARSAPVPI